MTSRIKILRKTLKLTQRKFGEELGVSRDVISNLEYNRVKPKPLLIKHICKLYNVNEHWLNTGEGDIFNNNFPEFVKTNEAIDIFKNLQPEFQDYALRQIKQLLELQNKSKSNNK